MKISRFIRVRHIIIMLMITTLLPALAENNLRKLILPKKLDTIETEAFYGDSSVEYVELPEGTRRIMGKAFADSGLKRIYIPDTVNYIASSAFDGCEDLVILASAGSYADNWAKNWRVRQGNTYYSGENIYAWRAVNRRLSITGIMTSYISYRNLNIPPVINGYPVVCIDEKAFAYTDFHNVIVPEGVTDINFMAFADCQNLESIILPDSLSTIGSFAFDTDKKLVNVILPEGLSEMGAGAFSECTALRSMVIPSGINNLHGFTFSGCTSLENIFLPDSITRIGVEAFYDCMLLNSVNLPADLTVIDERAFYNCKSLQEIKIPYGVTSIGKEAFAKCNSLERVEIPSSVQSIGKDAFPKNVKLFGQSGSATEYYALTNEIEFEVAAPEIVLPGKLMGRVLSGDDGKSYVPNALVKLYRGNSMIAKAATSGQYSYSEDDSWGYYSFRDLAPGEYKIEVEAKGFLPFTGYVTIKADEVTHLETLLMIQGEETQHGVASGKITDSITDDPLAGAHLAIKKNWNSENHDQFIDYVDTDANGCYLIDLPIGNYTAVVTHTEEYISSSFNLIVLPDKNVSDQNHSLTKVVNSDQYRVVLTWGSLPRDLDAHVEGALSNGGSYHVYYSQKKAMDGNVNVCNLDRDDTQGHGREVITIQPTTTKPFYYYIHLYADAGNGTIPASGARIEIYKGGKQLRVVNVPTTPSSKRYWNVFSIENGKLLMRNTFTDSPDIGYENNLISVKANPSEYYIGKGQSFVPSLDISDPWGHVLFTRYSVTSGSSVEVSKNGASIMGVQPGKSTVKCEVLSYDTTPASDNATVYVVYDTEISEFEMGVGETFEITPKQYLLPSGTGASYNFSDVRWTSSDATVASVTGYSGSLTASIRALKAGTTTLLMRHQPTGAQILINLKVAKAPTSITLSPTEIKLGVNDMATISKSSGDVLYDLHGGAWNNMIFTSANDSIATVSSDGIIRGISKGTTRITVKAGNVSASLSVEVCPEPTGIYFKDDSGNKVTVLSRSALKNLKIALPEVVILEAGSVSKIKYTCTGNVKCNVNDGYFTATGGGSITVETYNHKTATLIVVYKSNATFEALQEAYALKKTAENKLHSTLRSVPDATWKKLISNFNTAKENAKEDKLKKGRDGTWLDGIQIVSGWPDDKVEKEFARLISEEASKSSDSLIDFSKTTTDTAIVKRINQIIANRQTTKYSFKVDGVSYTYTPALNIGKDSLGRIMMGTVTNKLNGSSTEMVVSVTNIKGIQKFMTELKNMADAQIKGTVTSFINGGVSYMGVADVLDFIKGMYVNDNKYFKEILLDAAKMTSSKLGDIISKCVIDENNDDRGCVYELMDLLKRQWDGFKNLVRNNGTLLLKAVNGQVHALSEAEVNEIESLVAEASTASQFRDFYNAAQENPASIMSLLK